MRAPRPDIRPDRERLLLARLRPLHLEQHGPAALVLVHQAAVLEVGDEREAALDARVADVAHLLAVELVPPGKQTKVECANGISVNVL